VESIHYGDTPLLTCEIYRVQQVMIHTHNYIYTLIKCSGFVINDTLFNYCYNVPVELGDLEAVETIRINGN